VVLGEKNAYEPLCRDCYNKVMAAERAAAEAAQK
jgi:thymidine kinase